MADNVTVDGVPVATDQIAGINHQRIKVQHGADGVATDTSAANPFPVTEVGTYGYATGIVAGTVTVPADAKLKRVSVLPSGGAATVKIGTGPTITVPADASFDEQIPGNSIGPAVVFGGNVGSYYVSWTV